MDYERIYREFIADRRSIESSLTGYVEKHHIVPRSMSGGDDPGNIIKLTASDHFFAHLLLAKIHGGPMWYAVNAMALNRGNGQRSQDRRFVLSSRRWYEVMKREFAAEHSRRMKGVHAGAAHPMYGKPCSPVALEKLMARHAAGDHPMKDPAVRAKVGEAHRGKVLSPETRALISKAKTGVKLSDATRAAMSAGHKGRALPPDVVAKIAAANTGKKRTPEQVSAMRARLIGRKLSPEHAAKCAAKLRHASRMKGKTHSAETKARMSAVNRAKHVYAKLNDCETKYVTLAMMRSAGMDI